MIFFNFYKKIYPEEKEFLKSNYCNIEILNNYLKIEKAFIIYIG